MGPRLVAQIPCSHVNSLSDSAAPESSDLTGATPRALLRRGLNAAREGWGLICATYNLRKLCLAVAA